MSRNRITSLQQTILLLFSQANFLEKEGSYPLNEERRGELRRKESRGELWAEG